MWNQLHFARYIPQVNNRERTVVARFPLFRSTLRDRTFIRIHKDEIPAGERGGSVVACRTPKREVGGSKPTAAELCPWAGHFTPRKYWLITQEAVAPSRHDWKIVDWDVKPQHKQTNEIPAFYSTGIFAWYTPKATILAFGRTWRCSQRQLHQR